MVEFQSYDWLDPGAKNKAKMKPTYELIKMVLKLELGSRLD